MTEDTECRWNMNNYGSPVCSVHGDKMGACARSTEATLGHIVYEGVVLPDKSSVLHLAESVKEEYPKSKDVATLCDWLLAFGDAAYAFDAEIERLRAIEKRAKEVVDRLHGWSAEEAAAYIVTGVVQ